MQADKNIHLVRPKFPALPAGRQISSPKFQEGFSQGLGLGTWGLGLGAFLKCRNLPHSLHNYPFILLLFILIQINSLYAQDPLLRHYATNEGLPSDKISPMIQDKDGFIWFGTDVGVTRFDGIKFRNFTIEDGLSDNFIVIVKSDSKGRVWFGGYNGTVSYWLNGKIYNATSDTLLRGITAEWCFVNIFEDHENNIWFISANEYLILKKNKIIRNDNTPDIGLHCVINSKSGPISVFGSGFFIQNSKKLKLRYRFLSNFTFQSKYLQFSDGSFIFLSYYGVVLQDDTVQKLIIPFNEDLHNVKLPGFALSADSLLWISTQGLGLYCYDLKNPSNSPKIYLKNKLTSYVLADKEGNIWISTLNDGLYMIPVWGEKVIVYNKDNGLASNQCYAINKLNTGELFVGMHRGKLNLISDTNISDFKMYNSFNLNNRVNRIISQNDDVWIATDIWVIHYNSKTACHHIIKCRDSINVYLAYIRQMNAGDLGLGNNKIYIAGSLYKFEYPVKCEMNSYATIIREKSYGKNFSIFCDRSGQIWYGDRGGLKSIKDSSFFDHSGEDVLLTNRINSITETMDSTLVLATHGVGLLFYKNGKIVNRITSAQGLCDNICRRVFVHKDRVYVCTPSGLSVLFYSKGVIQSIQNLNTGNFLPSNQVYDIFADDEDISVATLNGVAVISQGVFEKIKPIIPLLSITEIRVNDSLISLEGDYNFSYKQNSLKVSFIGINFQRPNEVNYRYRLKNNQPWNSTKNTSLEFSFLPPGDYNFHIQARVQNGNWSPLQSFAFTISPPFWNTIWFRIIIILALALLTYLIVKRRLIINRKKQEEKLKIEKQIAELEQQALQTMMNPHFIFNVMNSIQHFINSNNKESANNYLTDFATLIRMNLSISYKKFIPLDEEINYLNLFLKFEKLRFGDKLTYEINVDPAIDASEVTVAVMMIQPFVENAVWHGILPMKDKGHIRVQIDKEADDLIKIRVEDNGVGIDQKFITDDYISQTNGSHGLSMTMQRLILLGKTSGHRLYIRYQHLHPEKENKGTIAELILPAVFY